jgi:exodeoxyribonuclease VII large subunit
MNNNSHHLYERLREVRNKLAREANVEPYMVFQNKVLQAIAEKKPTTQDELADVKGMGEKKLAKYGSIILETIGELSDNPVETSEEEKVFSVSEYIDYVNTLITSRRVIIRGEVGRVDNRGNYTFFTLLDKNVEAVINCFIWQDRLDNFGVELKEGLELNIEGYSEIYKARGSFSFRVEHIALIGEGVLRLAFEKLKKKLESEGYFSEERKKPIADYVHDIGLITSQYADAKKDFLTHLGNFGYKINFYDVRVEGMYAIDDIISAIRWFNESRLPLDVIVLTRGGGSLESLQAFNSEAVAKAIFASKVPVLTGVGHENDVTIADLVADMRASTPTDAGKILSNFWKKAEDFFISFQKNVTKIFLGKYVQFRQYLLNIQEQLFSVSMKELKTQAVRLDRLQAYLELRLKNWFERVKNIQQRFLENRLRLDGRISSINARIQTNEKLLNDGQIHWFNLQQTYVTEIEQKLTLSDPTARLKLGYSIISGIDSKIIKSSDQIKIGDILKLKFYKGSADSKVEDVQT